MRLQIFSNDLMNHSVRHGSDSKISFVYAHINVSTTLTNQIDTFYNSLTSTDQDSLNAAAGGNLLTKTPKDALTLIENKSKVRTSRNIPVVAKVSTNTSTSGLSPDVAALTDAVKALLLKNTTPPASVKAVEETAVNYNQGNARHCPPSVAHQGRPPDFPPVQNN
ncbi:hypothetical protein Tco_1407682 [Tanacetum coccineum]